MSDGRPAPSRRHLAAIGGLPMAAGLSLGLVGLLTLGLGAPAGWTTAARELLVSGGDEPGTGIMRPDDHIGPKRDETAVVPLTLPTSTATTPTPESATLPAASTEIAARPPMQESTVIAAPTPPVADPRAPTPPALGSALPMTLPGRYRPITKVHIPRIQLEADVAPARLVEREAGVTWEVPAFRAGHAEATAGAGGIGNAVLLGHVASHGAGNVFQGLDRARIGDDVRILSGSDELEYRVVDIRAVPRTDVSFLRPTSAAGLVLVTCTGTWLPLLRDYTQRLVVRAVLTGPAEAAVAGAGSSPLITAFAERFSDEGRPWPSDPHSTAWLSEGGYRLFAREPGHFVAVGAPISRSFRDVVVTGAFRKVGGPPGGGYGLIVRDQGPGPRDGIGQAGRYYVFEVGDRGELGIWRREDDRWDDLLPWSPSRAVQPGAGLNVLTVRAIGTRLTFLVNGVPVASLEDAALPEGGVGVFLGGDFNEGRLEWLVVQAP
jgi:LPXTG-site transpeptidase (sortase) family protein